MLGGGDPVLVTALVAALIAALNTRRLNASSVAVSRRVLPYGRFACV
jgi:hypothetical protein